MNHTGSRSQSLLTIIKWLVFVMALGMVTWKLCAAKSSLQLEDVLSRAREVHPGWYVLILLFTVCNWLLESFKWRYAIRHIENISPVKSVRAVLAGLTLSSFVPYRVGEYIGRVMYLEPDNRVKGSVATVMASLSQLCATCLFGLAGMILAGDGAIVRTLVLVLFFAACLALYFNPKWLYRFLVSVKMLKRYAARLAVLNGYKTSELAVIGFFSLLRYLAFALPYVLMIQLFGIPLTAKMSVAAVCIIFMVQTLLPTFLFSDLLVRGSVPLGIISSMTGEEHLVYMLPGYILYVCNILLPVLAGGIIILISKYKMP